MACISAAASAAAAAAASATEAVAATAAPMAAATAAAAAMAAAAAAVAEQQFVVQSLMPSTTGVYAVRKSSTTCQDHSAQACSDECMCSSTRCRLPGQGMQSIAWHLMH